ncbi:MAG: hypothetical protein ING19_12915 [Azospirillum sp.]|nr:hypothetical protein [Azospirillum sp.]
MIDCAPGKNRDFEVLCHGDYMDVMRRWQDFAKNAFSASAPAASVGPGGGAAEEKDASETRLFMFEIDPSETAILNAAIAKMDQEALRSLVFSNPFVASENPQRPAKRRLEAVMEARA